MSTTSSPPLLTPVDRLPGVGSPLARLLERLGLRTAADLLFNFPRRYEDYTELTELVHLEVGTTCSVVANIREVDQRVTVTGKHVQYVLLEQNRHYLRAIWFNLPYMEKRFQVGQLLHLRGTVKENGGRFEMLQPHYKVLEPGETGVEKKLLPVYPLTEGLKQWQLRKITERVIGDYAGLIEEALPEPVRQELALYPIREAIEQVHFPSTAATAEEARRRLVVQELLVLQLALAMRRYQHAQGQTALPLPLTGKIRDRILGRMPFELTEYQQQAFAEIAADMDRAIPMNRLLHGDVGSGKTAVALCAILLAVAHGAQAALMAPTEILARQHDRTIREILRNSRVRIALWTGSTAHRQSLSEKIAAGEVDIVVGTQAIVQSELSFAKLGLVVIDEQHKFGVKQRSNLRQLSSTVPHYLVMTATPIPRTISMTVFGDLDVSALRRPERLRAPVHTYLGTDATREKWWDFVVKKLREGRQAYVIAPRVETDDEVAAASAERLYERLSNGPLAAFKLDLLHGRQSAEEKDAALRAFAAGQTQVLVATSVVEVGIDVPNATIMTIESAERFGLSQLHQLRGRVSRGVHPGFVCCFSTTDNPEDNDRLKAFRETNDGFELAEIDLRIRGPGNLFSTQQTGFPPLRIADLVRDAGLLQQIRELGTRIIAADPELQAEEHARLRQLVLTRYGQSLQLGNVG
ncbi:MAG: ATP-dependent DNA helicase RecG [Planctomycetota bacterium]|nr:ATP-dependent DNA helicase RecG [Blastopirellula sp.]